MNVEKNKKTIMQHCAMPKLPGGPFSGLQLLLKNELMKNQFNLPCVYQNRPAGIFNLILIWEMAREIRRQKPDCLHVRGLQNEGFHGVLAGKLAGVPKIVVSIHGSLGELSKINPLKRFLFKYFIEPFTLWLADGFYCVCRDQAVRLGLDGKKKFMGVVYNAAPVFSLFSPDERYRKRCELGVAENDFIGIYVGRLTKEKGLIFLGEALRTLWHDSASPAFKFIMVGDGDAAPELKHMLSDQEKSGNIIFAGARRDIAELLQAADFFVFPTLHENLSNALLEAGHAGLGIIATRIGGNPEVVKSDDCGILTEVCDSVALRDAIGKYIADHELCRRHGAKIRQVVDNDFAIEEIMEKIAGIYRDVIDGEDRIAR